MLTFLQNNKTMSNLCLNINTLPSQNKHACWLTLEALKHSFALRMFIADASFCYNNVTKDIIDDLVHADYVYYLMNVTKDDAVLPLDAYGGSKWSQLQNIAASSHNDNSDHLNHPNIRTTTRRKLTSFHYLCCHGTSTFSITCKDRNASSMASATNTTFGSGILSPSKGIAFNRDVDDFSSHGMTNAFESQPSESNCVKHKKCPLSSMSLTLMFHSFLLLLLLTIAMIS